MDDEQVNEHGNEHDEGPKPVTLADLAKPLQEAAQRLGWSELMPVQQRAIPYLQAGKDMMVQSHTGSGKTGAFVLPILEKIDPTLPQCQALMLVPTRELAAQVAGQVEELSQGMGINTVLVYGGVGYGAQLEGFRKGAHIVVGTPGRIIDHLIKGSLDLGHVSQLVFDEADRLMSMGFYPDMRRIRSYLKESRHSYMFSATFPPEVQGLAKLFLNEPGFLNLSTDSVHVSTTSHIYYTVNSMDKIRSLARIIDTENPSAAFIFCNTKANVNYVATVLQRFGYQADQISSDLTQQARDSVLGRVRKRNLRFLVATDVAARGIDVLHLSHVIQYDFPEDTESYIHRSGRTGRAGAGGVAIALVDKLEGIQLRRMADRYGIDMERREVPTEDEVRASVSERLVALLEAKYRDRDKLYQERMDRLIPLARSLAESDDEIGLLAMLLDDYYRARMQGPQETPEEAPAAPARIERKRDRKKGSGQGGRGRGGSGGGRRRR